MTTQLPTETPAAFVRRMGWGPGIVIEGQEGDDMARILITAVGEEGLLARQIDGGFEGLWTLACRDWKEVRA